MYEIMKPRSPVSIAQELNKFSEFAKSEEFNITEKIIILSALVEDYAALPYNLSTNKMISNHISNIVEHLNSINSMNGEKDD